MPRVISEFEGYRVVRGPDASTKILLKLERLDGYDALGQPRWMSVGEYADDIKQSGKQGGDATAKMCRWVSSLIPLDDADVRPFPTTPASGGS